MADHDARVIAEGVPADAPRSDYWIAHPGELLQSPVLLAEPLRSQPYTSRGGELVVGLVLDNPTRGQYYISHSGGQLSLGSGGTPLPPQIGERSFPTSYRPFNIGLDLP